MRSSWCIAWVLVFAGACREPEAMTAGTAEPGSTAADSSTGSSGAVVTTDASPTTTTPTSTSPTEATGSSTSSGADSSSATTDAALCGDGVMDPGEACDDGNGVDGDGCNDDCVVSGSELWTVTVNGSAGGHDCALGVAIGPTDDVFVAGFQDTVGQGSNAWLARYDPAGAELWSRSHNGAANLQDTGRAVAVDSAGNPILVGSENVAPGTNDILTVKYDAGGDVLWSDLHAGDAGDTDNGFGVAVDGGDNVLVVGQVRVLPSNDQAVVRKLDPAGAELWKIVYDGPVPNSWDQWYAIAAAPDGSFVVGGHETTAINDQDARIAGHDANGVETWHYPFAVLGAHDAAFGVAIDAEGKVAVTGYYPTAIAADIFVRVLDPGGGELWARDFDGASTFDDVGHDVTFDAAGNVAVIGYESVGGERQIWVRKYDPAGAVLWTATHNSDAFGTDAGNGIAADSQGNLVAVGCEITAGQGTDIWIRKYAP